MARAFNGTSDRITVGIGNMGFNGAKSLAILMRVTADGSANCPFYVGSSTGGANRWMMYVPDGSAVLQLQEGDNNGPATSMGLAAADSWQIVGVSKAAAATPRFHKAAPGGSWAHENGTGALADGTAPGTSCSIGARPSSDTWLEGEILAIAAWDRSLADSEWETMGQHFDDWFKIPSASIMGPRGAWLLNQGDVTQLVRDHTTGGSIETAIAGTSVVSDPSGFRYRSLTRPEFANHPDEVVRAFFERRA